jgi:hypothetical protein
MTKTNCTRPENAHNIIQFECLKGDEQIFYATLRLQ